MHGHLSFPTRFTSAKEKQAVLINAQNDPANLEKSNLVFNMPTFKDWLAILILLVALLVWNTSEKRPIAPGMRVWNQQSIPRARFFRIHQYYQAITNAQRCCMIFEFISSANAFCVSAIKDDHLRSMTCHFRCQCPLY